MSNGNSSNAIMYMEKIMRLLEYVRRGGHTWDSILDYVSSSTLSDFQVIGSVLKVVQNDGSIYSPAFFGWERVPEASLPIELVTIDNPVSRSLLTHKVVECGDFENYQFPSGESGDRFFPNGFGWSVAWPIPGVGSVVTFSSQRQELSIELELFLLTVGSILSLELSKEIGTADIIDRDHVLPKTRVPISFALTSRQWTIVAAIRKGSTNPEIAKDLGFSESLVRQETMEIYRKLKISGRKELQALDEIESATTSRVG